jgi:glycerophosphoryl diester phosphodiesterase
MLLVAHRGSSAQLPENTMPAFRQAVRDGADMIEFDVRLSADGVPVVIHDRRLNRTARRPGRVRDLSSGVLAQVDVGGARLRGRVRERLRARVRQGLRARREDRSRIGIPLLEDLFAGLPRTIGFDIELKTDGDRRRRGELVRQVAQLIARAGDGRRILVTSFDHRALRLFRRRSPGTPVGVLYFPVRDMGIGSAVLARRSGAGVYVCSRAQLRLRHVRDAHRSQILVLVYGVNTLRQFRQVERRGVDGVITDHPARLRHALRTEKDGSPP